MAFQGKLALIDLSDRSVSIKEIPTTLREKFLGGRGLDAYLLYNHVPPACDPLGPANVLIVSSGLIGGLIASSSGRSHIMAKSPLTGFVGSSNIGGYFAPELRFAGFDHLIIKGKASSPSYLWIHDGEIELRDATGLWGKDVFETQRTIERELQDTGVQTLCIGPAGEKLVRFATIMTGFKNAAGRTGMGAVMGSKNLKAIVARGRGGIEIDNPREAIAYNKSINNQILSTKIGSIMQKWGTLFIYGATNPMGFVRTNNFLSNQLEDGEGLEAENIEEVLVGHGACFGCQVHCRSRYLLKEGRFAGTYAEGPEYSSQGAFGSMVGCRDLNTVLACNHLVNREGIDTLETGNMIAWAMELFEKGIITRADTDGIDLHFGNDHAVIEMVERIAARTGFGSVLAEGPLRAAQAVGRGSEYYLVQVKGMSNLHSDERPTPALALGIATSSRGADHIRSRPGIDVYNLPLAVLERVYRDNPAPYSGPIVNRMDSYEGKAWMVVWQEHNYMAVDALGVCKFHTVFMSPNLPSFPEFSKLVALNTGLSLTPLQIWDAANRSYTLERMFNIREGLTRAHDTLPERYFTVPTPAGSPMARGKCIDRGKFERMLDEYYELHEWDAAGVPTRRLLKRLGIDSEPSHLL
ncbi:MAG TPA: aldehyde ferredoxin oxidoreductase family protein [Syntrophorhabdales bacterium]|nr:aldehyde ferredoxin oxidoreductase family protein [Syntrophorhabdales bacterium]